MKKFLLASVCLCLFSLSGCAYYVAPVMPPSGFLFASFEAPIDTDANQTKVAPKMGASSSSSILCLFAFGDASVNSAARNGNISTIDHVDYAYLNIVFIYQKFTTKVYGE